MGKVEGKTQLEFYWHTWKYVLKYIEWLCGRNVSTGFSGLRTEISGGIV